MAARAVILNFVITLNLVMVAGCKQKMTEGLMTFVLNLTLTCYGYLK